MPAKSRDLEVAVTFFELLLKEDPDQCQVERWRIERAMKIVRKMQRGHAVRDDEVNFVVNVAAKAACSFCLQHRV